MLFLRLDRTLVWKIYFHLRPVRVVKAALQDGKILFLHIVIARVSASTPPKSALPSTMATSIENCSLSLFYLQWVSWHHREQNVGKFRTTKAIFQIICNSANQTGSPKGHDSHISSISRWFAGCCSVLSRNLASALSRLRSGALSSQLAQCYGLRGTKPSAE